MKSKQTQGPWQLAKGRYDYYILAGKKVVSEDVPLLADAVLIAAAPDLLKALQRLENVSSAVFDTENPKIPGDWKSAILDARAAISKATQNQ